MIAVVQRVNSGKVIIQDKTFSEIGNGYVILLGIFEEDTEEDVKKLTEKISTLRVMSDENKKMNRSITDVKGEILVVSQFTLVADLTYGRRPSFVKAKKPEEAQKLYLQFIHNLEMKDIPVKTGVFGAYMTLELSNDGPVTIIANSKKT